MPQLLKNGDLSDDAVCEAPDAAAAVAGGVVGGIDELLDDKDL